HHTSTVFIPYTTLFRSKRVNIYTDEGEIVKGVFGWPAIHTRSKEKEQAPQLDNICIDVGCTTKKEVEELGIHVGAVVTYPDEFLDRKEHTSELQSRFTL